jgi:hypothetical protein
MAEFAHPGKSVIQDSVDVSAVRDRTYRNRANLHAWVALPSVTGGVKNYVSLSVKVGFDLGE